MPEIVFLTDRLSDGRLLARALGLADRANVVGLHQAASHGSGRPVILCDVSMDKVGAAALVHAALTHLCPELPRRTLFLVRDHSELALAQARSLGASVILPRDAMPRDIAAALQELQQPGGRLAGTDGTPVRVEVAQAGSVLRGLFTAAAGQQAPSPALLEQGAQTVIGAIRNAGIQGWLDIVWRTDDATYQHCLLVAGLVAAFAARLKLSLPAQRLLSQAALIHDIGKARIPRAILNKPAALTPPEMAVMRTHAAIGHEMLTRRPGQFDPLLLSVVRHHHEYLDGSGYPDRLRGGDIPHFVRITTICDIYAALIERRPYKPPNSPQMSLEVLRGMTGKLDRELLAEFEVMVLGRAGQKAAAAAQAAR